MRSVLRPEHSDGGHLLMDRSSVLFSVLGSLDFCAAFCIPNAHQPFLHPQSRKAPLPELHEQSLHLGYFLDLIFLAFLPPLGSTK